MINKMTLTHVDDVAKIHFKNFKEAFLCELGLPFLKVLYRYIVTSKSNFGYVTVQNSKVIAFITGTLDSDNFLGTMLKKNAIHLFFPILYAIAKKPSIINKMFQTILYPNKSKSQEKAELFSICVDKEQRQKKLGTNLLNKLTYHFKNANITKFKVIVDTNNLNANSFYTKNKFKFIRTFKMYNKKMSLYTVEVS